MPLRLSGNMFMSKQQEHGQNNLTKLAFSCSMHAIQPVQGMHVQCCSMLCTGDRFVSSIHSY